MAIRKKLLSALLIACLISTALSAKQGWQMLEWDEEMPEWVMKYEVVIEQRTDENSPWEEIRRLMTEDNTPQIKIDPLLPGATEKVR